MNKAAREKKLEEENKRLKKENEALKTELKSINDLAKRELKRMEQEDLIKKFGYERSDLKKLKEVLGEEITEEKIKALKEFGKK